MNVPAHLTEPDRHLSILELQGDPLHYVLEFLDTKSLCNAMQVCKGWQAAGCDDNLWRRIAESTWPPSTLRLRPYYQTYQEMVKGNNVHSAWPVMDLVSMGKCSTYKYNLPNLFYQCRLFALQYDTKHEQIRLTFDARGEFDLRPARTSHIALVRDKAEHDYNPGGQMQPDDTDLMMDYSACAQNTLLFEDTPGHFQGVFVLYLPAIGQLPTYFKEHVHDVDTSVVFCYANRVFQPPIEYLEADYRCVELFKIPAGRSFQEMLLQSCTTFELPREPERRLQAQTSSGSRALWHSVPDKLYERSEWWR